MASDAVFVGRAFDILDEELAAWRTPNGGLILYGNRGTKLGFDPGQLTAFRELLDRAAMPGQVSG